MRPVVFFPRLAHAVFFAIFFIFDSFFSQMLIHPFHIKKVIQRAVIKLPFYEPSDNLYSKGINIYEPALDVEPGTLREDVEHHIAARPCNLRHLVQDF